MALARDDVAASPIVVLTTFVLVAVLLTVAIYALFFDQPANEVALVAQRDGGALAFDVAKSSGGLDWQDVTLRFLDRAGRDLAPDYLQLPEGAIDVKDRIGVDPLPPGGTYLLLVFLDGEELSRLAVTV